MYIDVLYNIELGPSGTERKMQTLGK